MGKTVSERFVDVFKEQVAQNPTAEHQEPVEPCIGCMAQPSNVKLQRVCPSSSGAVPAGADPPSDSCVNCYCRPMWCVDCMAKCDTTIYVSDFYVMWEPQHVWGQCTLCVLTLYLV